MIPRRIFTIWFSKTQTPSLIRRCIASQKLPDYEHVLIDETQINGTGKYAFSLTESDYVRDALESEKWVRVSDYLRVYYLLKFGGIYLDADVELLPGRNFDRYLQYPAFCGYEGGNTDWYGFAVVGSEAGNSVLKQQRETVDTNWKRDQRSPTFGFDYSMGLFNNLFRRQNPSYPLHAAESTVFYPYSHVDGTVDITDRTISYHHFMKSWCPTPDNKQQVHTPKNQQVHMPKPNINFSIVAIVRNEAKTLPRLIKSLKEYTDRGGEIVIVDTGSTDDTANIAESMGCKVDRVGDRFKHVIPYEDCVSVNARFLVNDEPPILQSGDSLFDFASARNHAASLASNNCVMFVDGDEIYTKLDIDAVQAHVARGVGQFEYEFIFSHDQYGNPAIRFRQCKAYDKTKLQWQGRIHEMLVGSAERCYLPETVYKIEHWQNQETNRSGYLRGLALDCYEDPKNDRHSHYFARELFWTGRTHTALKEFERHLTLGGWAAERGQSLIFMGEIHQTLKNEEKAIECWQKAFAVETKRREPLIKLALLYHAKQDPHATAAYAAAALEIPPSDFYANDNSHYTHLPHELMYWAKWHLGDRAGAKHHFLKAIHYQPNNPKYIHESINFFEYQDPQIEGWMSFEELQFLYDTAKQMQTIAEIGSWKGRSTHALLTGASRGLGGAVTAIDHFKGSVGEDEAHKEAKTDAVYEQFVRNVGKLPNLTVIRSSSEEAAQRTGMFDMVFIDADHTYEGVMKDIALWRGKVNKVLCGHDYCDAWAGVKRAVDESLGKPDEVYGSIWVKRISKI